MSTKVILIALARRSRKSREGRRRHLIFCGSILCSAVLLYILVSSVRHLWDQSLTPLHVQSAGESAGEVPRLSSLFSSVQWPQSALEVALPLLATVLAVPAVLLLLVLLIVWGCTASKWSVSENPPLGPSVDRWMNREWRQVIGLPYLDWRPDDDDI